MDKATTIGEKVIQFRGKRKLTRAELAKKAGISVQVLWLIETGKTTDPKASTIKGLAKALEIDPGALL